MSSVLQVEFSRIKKCTEYSQLFVTSSENALKMSGKFKKSVDKGFDNDPGSQLTGVQPFSSAFIDPCH